MRVGSPDELDTEPLRAAQEQGARILPLLLPGDHDPGSADSAPQARPLADPEGDVVDPAEGVPLLGVVEPEHLVPEQEERVVRAFPDDVHSQLLDKESLRLRAVADSNVNVVETQKTEFPGGRVAGHERPTPSPAICAGVPTGPGRGPGPPAEPAGTTVMALVSFD